MTDVLDRVRKLLALATSPFPEEARTAAVKAAQLIREHGIELHEHGAAPRPAAPTQEPMRERRIIVSKYDGTCSACGEYYEAGERVAWARGRGALHVACHRQAASGGAKR